MLKFRLGHFCSRVITCVEMSRPIFLVLVNLLVAVAVAWAMNENKDETTGTRDRPITGGGLSGTQLPDETTTHHVEVATVTSGKPEESGIHRPHETTTSHFEVATVPNARPEEESGRHRFANFMHPANSIAAAYQASRQKIKELMVSLFFVQL